ncbi:hypothetical protein L484_005693 [Morus notabilis]|uniref:Uncharacterized protein n=1 Tax=Morus notabilis TaxID=981085 RepID=W9RZ18_9ROSA|nr:hypothetical protein L484_005693 [Morus notabilis]
MEDIGFLNTRLWSKDCSKSKNSSYHPNRPPGGIVSGSVKPSSIVSAEHDFLMRVLREEMIQELVEIENVLALHQVETSTVLLTQVEDIDLFGFNGC